jgi:4-hydroxyacetophenone monooxygenase
MTTGVPSHLGQTVITDDDEFIARALEDVSIPALMMSMVHMSGDPSLLRGDHRPVGIYLNEVQGFMAPEDQAAVRQHALEVIADYRDAGCVLPPPPGPELIHEMMNVLVAQEVPDEYVEMMVEELELDGSDVRDLHWLDDVPAGQKDTFHVVVIGAGMSGLLAAIRLGGAGIPFTVIEKNAGVGGTWWENRYPGCRVDVGNHFYCYSFAPNNPSSRATSNAACTSSTLPTTSASGPRWFGRVGTGTPPAGRSTCARPAVEPPPSKPTP